MILVDTNVLLDLVTDDRDWSRWSVTRLEEAALAGPIFINDVVYAETSIRYNRIEDLEAMLEGAKIEIAPIPRPALFLGGRPFNDTVPLAGRERECCRISSLALMPRSRVGSCLPAIRAATAPISLSSC